MIDPLCNCPVNEHGVVYECLEDCGIVRCRHEVRMEERATKEQEDYAETLAYLGGPPL